MNTQLQNKRKYDQVENTNYINPYATLTPFSPFYTFGSNDYNAYNKYYENYHNPHLNSFLQKYNQYTTYVNDNFHSQQYYTDNSEKISRNKKSRYIVDKESNKPICGYCNKSSHAEINCWNYDSHNKPIKVFLNTIHKEKTEFLENLKHNIEKELEYRKNELNCQLTLFSLKK